MRRCGDVRRLEGGCPVVLEGSATHDGGCGVLATSVDLLQKLLEMVRGQEATAAQGQCWAT